MSKSTSVKTYSTPYIESMAGDGLSNPHELVASLEEAFASNFLHPVKFTNRTKPLSLKELMEKNTTTRTTAEELAEFHERRVLAGAKWQQKLMIFRNFGKYLEKDEMNLINQAKEGLESVEDRLAAMCYAVEQIKSRKKWKAEQTKSQQSTHSVLVTAKKEKVGDKNQWVGSTIHELPPITKGKAHEPAYYAMKLPDGRIVNLGASQSEYAPVKNVYPSRALRNIATRLGLTPVGGDTAVLNAILGEELSPWTNGNGETKMVYKFLPSYTAAWQGNVWLVYVGWRLNPVCSSGEFHRTTPEGEYVPPFVENADGELERYNPAYHSPEEVLTTSQLDYNLLCESKDLAITNEDGEVVDFMNEEEEFLTFCPQREGEPDFIDFSKYCEDDEEMELFQACSSVVERSESGITMGDLQSKAFVQEYIHDGIEEAKETIRRCSENPSPFGDQIIEWMQAKITRLVRIDDLWNKYVGETFEAPHKPSPSFTAKGDFKEPSRILDCMTVMPLNEIEQPKVTRHEFMPWPSKTIQVSLGQAKQLRKQKKVLGHVLDGTIRQKLRNTVAALTFADTLDTLLSASR